MNAVMIDDRMSNLVLPKGLLGRSEEYEPVQLYCATGSPGPALVDSMMPE